MSMVTAMIRLDCCCYLWCLNIFCSEAISANFLCYTDRSICTFALSIFHDVLILFLKMVPKDGEINGAIHSSLIIHYFSQRGFESTSELVKSLLNLYGTTKSSNPRCISYSHNILTNLKIHS